MSSSAAQAKAQALNAKLEAEARMMLDEVDQKHARKLARQSHVCAVACYDKAGVSGLGDALEHCVNQCQFPYRQGNAMVQQVCTIIVFSHSYVMLLWFASINQSINQSLYFSILGSESISKSSKSGHGRLSRQGPRSNVAGCRE
jgi:Eukaryotic protein of unknown function (DUF842)